MDILNFYDTETTGIPEWSIPSDDPSQPHIVSLAALKCDAYTRQVVSSLNLVIRPDGWTIPDETIEIHGITNEQAAAYGVPEELAVAMFLAFVGDDGIAVGHNESFDRRMVRIALKRYDIFDEEVMEEWAKKERHLCTMWEARSIMGGKKPKLSEAYAHFIGEPMSDAHSAHGDAKSCMELYWAMQDHKAEL